MISASRTALGVAVIMLAGGCADRPLLVRDVTIDGFDLVIEKCRLSESANDCTTERRRLPMRTRVVPRPRPFGAAVSFASARAPLERCAEQFHVTGIVKLTLVVDHGGRVIAVDPDTGGEDFAECARAACGALQFPTSQRGTKLEISFQPAPGQEAK